MDQHELTFLPYDQPEKVSFLKPRYIKGLANAASHSSFLNSTLVNRLHVAESGDLLLIPDQLQSLEAEESIEVTFEPIKKLRWTREQSAGHGVQFGRLAIKSNNCIPAQEYVAYKPDLSVEQAVREAAASRFVNTENVVGSAYDPLGFLKQLDGGVVLITRFAGQTETFDNVLWKNPSEVTDGQVVDALSKAAKSLAYLHAAGMTHGDAQPKNIAWDTQSDQPWHVDLETARRYTEYGDRTYYKGEVIDDLQTFMLYQPCKRSMDMFDMVAEKYIQSYESQSNNYSPVNKDAIMGITSMKLKVLPIV